MGRVYTRAWIITKEDDSDRLNPAYVKHKYSKLPAWMFHGIIIMGEKDPTTFWEKK
jgi:hypothetical protein